MRAVDTKFMHTYFFLFFRFKPDAYYFALVFIMRNLIVALVPGVLPDAITQVFTITLILLVWLTTCAIVFPWRMDAHNYLDAAANIHMIMLLCVSGFFVVN